LNRMYTYVRVVTQQHHTARAHSTHVYT